MILEVASESLKTFFANTKWWEYRKPRHAHFPHNYFRFWVHCLTAATRKLSKGGEWLLEPLYISSVWKHLKCSPPLLNNKKVFSKCTWIIWKKKLIHVLSFLLKNQENKKNGKSSWYLKLCEICHSVVPESHSPNYCRFSGPKILNT